jgi:hypothetical protein
MKLAPMQLLFPCRILDPLQVYNIRAHVRTNLDDLGRRSQWCKSHSRTDTVVVQLWAEYT